MYTRCEVCLAVLGSRKTKPGRRSALSRRTIRSNRKLGETGSVRPCGRTRARSESTTEDPFRDTERRPTDRRRRTANAVQPRDAPRPLFDTPRRVRKDDVCRTDHCVTRRTANHTRVLTDDNTSQNLLDRRRRHPLFPTRSRRLTNRPSPTTGHRSTNSVARDRICASITLLNGWRCSAQ